MSSSKTEFGKLAKKVKKYLRARMPKWADCQCEDLWDYEYEHVESSASALDDNGVLELLYFARRLNERLDETYVPVGKILVDDGTTDFTFFREIKECLESPLIASARKMLVDGMSMAVATASKNSVIGKNDQIDKELDKAIGGIMESFYKLHYEVYATSGRKIENVSWFDPCVQVFGSLAECLMNLEKSRDGIYVCFIAIPGTVDGWFGYFVKSNGNIFSYHDRMDEEYVGQHNNFRNNRHVEDKGFDVFPYDLCEFSDEHDYKGYAKSMSFGDQKEILLAGGKFESFMRTMLIIFMLSHKYAGKTITDSPVIIDSLMPSNLNAIGEGEEAQRALVKVGDSSVAEYHSHYKAPEFDTGKVLAGDYNARFDFDSGGGGFFKGNNQAMVDAYGVGFKPDLTKVFYSTSSKRLIGDSECRMEFVGDAKRFELRAYYEIRRQLANYIRKGMEKDYESFGGVEKLKEWYKDELRKSECIERIRHMCAGAYAREGMDGRRDYIDEGNADNRDTFDGECCSYILIDKAAHDWGYRVGLNEFNRDTCKYRSYDSDMTANVFFQFYFGSSEQVESALGIKLPKFCSGWRRNGVYNGNSILDVCDPVGRLEGPLSREFHFEFVIGFAKSEIKKMCKEYGFKIRKAEAKEESEG